MSIRETFSNLIDLAVINEYDKGDVDFSKVWSSDFNKVSAVFWYAYHIVYRSILSNETF